MSIGGGEVRSVKRGDGVGDWSVDKIAKKFRLQPPNLSEGAFDQSFVRAKSKHHPATAGTAEF